MSFKRNAIIATNFNIVDRTIPELSKSELKRNRSNFD
jgi:hypothetical protein